MLEMSQVPVGLTAAGVFIITKEVILTVSQNNSSTPSMTNVLAFSIIYVLTPVEQTSHLINKESGTLYIQKCPWKKHVGMWIYCPDS